MDRQERKKIKHDEFVDSTMHVFQFLEEHPKPFLAGLVGIVLAVVLIFAGMEWSKSSKVRSADRLARATAALDAPVVASGAKPDDPYRPTYATEQDRDRQAAARLADAAKIGGAAGGVAEYLRGVALLRAGDAAGAVQALEQASERVGSDPTVGSSVKAALAEAYTAAGQGDKAAGIWRALSNDDSGYPRDLALLGLGRACERAGKRDEAMASYRQAAADAGSSVAPVAKSALARLGG